MSEEGIEVEKYLEACGKLHKLLEEYSISYEIWRRTLDEACDDIGIKMEFDFSDWITIHEDLWEEFQDMPKVCQQVMEHIVTETFKRRKY